MKPFFYSIFFHFIIFSYYNKKNIVRTKKIHSRIVVNNIKINKKRAAIKKKKGLKKKETA